MKKNYFAPESEIVELNLQGFLCASDPIEDGAPAVVDPTPDNGEDDGL